MARIENRTLVKLRNDGGYRTGVRLARVANVVGFSFLLWSYAFAEGPESSGRMFTVVWLICVATLLPAVLLVSGALARHTGRSLFNNQGSEVQRVLYRDLFTPLPRRADVG